jgi:tetratricopeptide (TPR) repeat protein
MTAPSDDVKSIFGKALELSSAADRAAYLDQACEGDPALRAEVEGLLRALDAAGPFLNRPAGDARAEVTTDQPGETPGTVIAGRYKLLEQLGEGGMGAVWVAEQTQPVRRKVAVKLIKMGMDSRSVLSRFEAERQALALMDHPNIAKVLDGGRTEQGRPFFVMEYVKGVPLTRYCDEARLTVRERLELFVPVCQAVQHAHQKGIIHRDLKPSNILVCLYDGRPVPKVIDFGLAKALHQPLTEHTLYTAHGIMLGTPLYMSPEQAEFNNLDVDTRTDVYALGVILYELLTGTTPLEKGRLKQAAWQEIIRLIKEEEPSRPSAKLSGSGSLPSVAAQRRVEPLKLSRLLRGELDWIVMKALEKDRARRYETANGLARDVERYLHDEAVEACPPSTVYRLRKMARKHRTALRVAAACLLLLVAGVAVSSWQALRARRAEAAALAARDAEAVQRHEAELQRDAKDKALQAEAEQRRQAVTQKQRADDEAAITRAVNEFLQNDLLGQADIGNQAGDGARNPRITVRELLDRAARGIETKFVGQELTEASIRLTLGEAYRALGEYPEAQKHLERSLALFRVKLGADDPATLTSMNDLAVLYHHRGRYDEAEPLYQQVLASRRARLGADNPYTLVNMHNLARMYRDRGRYDEAEPMLKHVLEATRAKRGPDHRNTLASMDNLAMLYYDRGRYDAAEALCKQALEGRRATLGADHPETLTSMNNLAIIYCDRGRYDEVEPLYKQVLEGRRAKLGADHPDTVESVNGLAMLYQARGRYLEAQSLSRQALEVTRARLGTNHPQTLTCMNNLAALYHHRGRYEEAEPLYKQALEGRRAKLGVDHPETISSMNNLGVLDIARGCYDEAEALLKQALEASRTKLGAQHPMTANSLNNLALLYQALGRYAEAEPLRKQALETVRAQLGADHPHTLICLNNLALCYGLQERYAEAEPLFKQALEGYRAKLGADHPDTLTSLNNLAHLCKARGRFDQAESLYKQVLGARRERQGSDHPDTLSTMYGLGELYQDRGRYGEAEPLLRQALAGCRAKLGPDHPQTLSCMSSLAACYQALGRDAEAEPLSLAIVVSARKKLGLAHPKVEANIYFLGQLYLKQGKPERGEPLLQELAASMQQKHGADSAAYARSLAHLSAILLAQKKYAEAESVTRECLAIRQRKEPDAWTTFNVESFLGAALLGQKKYAEAERRLLEGYRGMKEREAKIDNSGKARLTQALERLVRLYEATGKKDEAAKWRKSLEEAKKAAAASSHPSR